MKLIGKAVLMGILVAAMLWGSELVSQRHQLSENIIRLHVVADSDSEEDQRIKLLVRDGITEYLNKKMESVASVEDAKCFLAEHLPEIQNIANGVLSILGCEDTACVTLKQEAFSTRHYDTFSLPAGVYESLRIVIGEGSGQNWWCVVFPQLCVPATAEDFSEEAVACGYSDSLTATLTGDEDYEVRFFLLDCLGKLENFLFAS